MPGFWDTVGQDLSALGSGATNVLSNPLFQAAANAYLGFAGSARERGLGGAIQSAGVGALQPFTPQAQMERLQTQQMQQQLAPISKDEIEKLNTLIANSGNDPQQASFFDYLKTEYQNRRMSAGDVAGAIEKWNEPKRMGDWIKAQAAMYGAQTGGAIMQSAMPGMKLPTPTYTAFPGGPPIAAPVPASGAPTTAPPATGTATGGASSAPEPPAGTPFKENLGGSEYTVIKDPTTSKYYYLDPSGKQWIPIS